MFFCFFFQWISKVKESYKSGFWESFNVVLNGFQTCLQFFMWFVSVFFKILIFLFGKLSFWNF